MDREAAWATGRPGIEDELVNLQSYTAAFSGHLVEANALTERAAGMARQAEEKEAAAGYLAEAGLREVLTGNLAAARRWTAAALQVSDDQDAETALLLAFVGDLARAQKLADDLAKRNPQDALNPPIVRAVMALRQKAPAKAISDLQVAAPYEFGDVGQLSLYPAYIRGQAFLAEHQGAAAAAEFQKILDHPGLALNEIISPLAHLGLAHAYVLEGDTTKAKAAYRDFLTLWRDADPDTPILKQAKTEYTKLQQAD